MEPNLLVGDRLFVTKYSYGYSKHSFPFSPKIFSGRIIFSEPQPGDVVVFKTPADNRTDYIKRLIGLPGDKIQVLNGILIVNGVKASRKKTNLGKLSVGRFVDISLCSFDEVRKDVDVGILISNPPYGKRMGDDINIMYSKLGDWMKREMQGFNCWILSSNIEAYKDLGLKPNKKIKVFNGDLECSFRNYSIYAGSKKSRFQE